MGVVIQPAAAQDIRDQRAYYEHERAGLGSEYILALERLFERLTTFPRSSPEVEGFPGVRRAALRRFPYAVFYLEDVHGVNVLRIIHTAREAEPRLPPG